MSSTKYCKQCRSFKPRPFFSGPHCTFTCWRDAEAAKLRRNPRKRINPRSKKRAAVVDARRAFVEDVLRRNPICFGYKLFEAWNHPQLEFCTYRATEVHELLKRSRAGDANAAILAPENVVALCSSCHAWTEAEPAEAQRLGLLIPSWVSTAGAETDATVEKTTE